MYNYAYKFIRKTEKILKEKVVKIYNSIQFHAIEKTKKLEVYLSFNT